MYQRFFLDFEIADEDPIMSHNAVSLCSSNKCACLESFKCFPTVHFFLRSFLRSIAGFFQWSVSLQSRRLCECSKDEFFIFLSHDYSSTSTIYLTDPSFHRLMPLVNKKLGIAIFTVTSNVITAGAIVALLFVAAIEPPTHSSFILYATIIYATFPLALLSQLSSGAMLDRVTPHDQKSLAQGINNSLYDFSSEFCWKSLLSMCISCLSKWFIILRSTGCYCSNIYNPVRVYIRHQGIQFGVDCLFRINNDWGVCECAADF